MNIITSYQNYIYNSNHLFGREETTVKKNKRRRSFNIRADNLESVQQHEGHHKTEKTHSLGQSESQNGVREELLLEGGVSGVANDEGTENGSDSCSRSSGSNSGGSSSDVLSGHVNVAGDRGGL